MPSRTALLFIVPMVVGTAVQAVAGNFPVSFFSFPLSGLFGALWVAALVVLYRERRQSWLVGALLSGKATAWSLGLFVAGCLVIGLFPQLRPSEAAARGGVAGMLGCYNFMSSWPFVIMLVLLLSHLGLVTLRGFLSKRPHRWRFLLNHAGVWLALFAGFVGAADGQDTRLLVERDGWNRLSYDRDSRPVYQRESYRLVDFEKETYPDGTPMSYRARVLAAVPGADTVCMHLAVNEPYGIAFGRDVYLSGYDQQSAEPRYCILQIVHQPARWLMQAGIVRAFAGAALLLAGGPVRRRAAERRTAA